MTRHHPPPTRPSEDDIIALVVAANPLEDRDVTLPNGSALDLRVAAVVAAIADVASVAPTRRRRRRIWIGLGAAVAVLGGGGAITWAVTRSSPAVNPTGIVCYDSPAQNIGVVIGATGASPLELCAQQWTDGELGHGDVPNLVGCVGSGGAPAVYASDDPQLCEHMGLAVLDEVIPPEQLAIIDFTNDMGDAAHSAGCIDLPTFLAIVNAQLADKGIADTYSINVLQAPDAAMPCASFGVNPVEHTIEIQALPDIFTQASDSPAG